MDAGYLEFPCEDVPFCYVFQILSISALIFRRKSLCGITDQERPLNSSTGIKLSYPGSKAQ